jgi:tetraacyldisaccharide 4'-kinase
VKARLRKAVTAAMDDDGRAAPFSLAAFLSVASRLYGLAARARTARYRGGRSPVRRLPCKVISIGNITVGGVGKTPMTQWLAARLRDAGHRVAVVSRGYGGGAEKRSGVVSDGRKMLMDPEMAGDEPYMTAARLPGVPVLVGRDRCASGLRAVSRFDCGVVLLDDGFQHLKLERDLDLVLMDAARPLGNGRLLPRGPLREPPGALSRAHGIVLTRCDEARSFPAIVDRYAPGTPVFKSVHTPYPHLFLPAGRAPARFAETVTNPAETLSALRGRRVMGFSGIARNDAFEKTLRRLAVETVGFMGFSDHHRYAGADLRAVLKTAEDRSADLLATTEKDWVRLADRSPWPLDFLVLGVRFDPGGDGDDLFRLAARAL